MHQKDNETHFIYLKDITTGEEIFDNKQTLSVKLEYDKNGREILRKFGNGTTEATLYDKAGRTIVKAQNSERGELLWAEGYLYGEDGKRTATVFAQALANELGVAVWAPSTYVHICNDGEIIIAKDNPDFENRDEYGEPTVKQPGKLICFKPEKK